MADDDNEPIPIDPRHAQKLGGHDLEVLVSEMNAKALSDALERANERIADLEVKMQAIQFGLASTNQNLQKQSQFIGSFVQRVGGTGSTVPDSEG